MVKVVKVYRGGVIKLPAEARRALGLIEGKLLLLTVEGGRIILEPFEEVDPVEKYSSSLPPGVDEDEILRSTGEIIESLAARKLERLSSNL
ncbi:MAG: AbrB/MazE/SpoVT family DNA-binding domain-containing protein [Thermofilaceae archaeon]